MGTSVGHCTISRPGGKPTPPTETKELIHEAGVIMTHKRQRIWSTTNPETVFMSRSLRCCTKQFVRLRLTLELEWKSIFRFIFSEWKSFAFAVVRCIMLQKHDAMRLFNAKVSPPSYPHYNCDSKKMLRCMRQMLHCRKLILYRWYFPQPESFFNPWAQKSFRKKWRAMITSRGRSQLRCEMWSMNGILLCFFSFSRCCFPPISLIKTDSCWKTMMPEWLCKMLFVDGLWLVSVIPTIILW